ncbi:MAG: hypothetical protein ACXVAU_19165 [Mucilaginibacter sp.]
MMKNTFKASNLLLPAAFILAPFIASAQCAAPVDGGLSVLLIAGVAGYTAKKAADKKKNTEK